MLKSYFDGGNQADSTQYDVLVLVAISGTVGQWKPFEREWHAALRGKPTEYIHVTDMLDFDKDFSREKGWNEALRDKVLNKCARIAGRHFARFKTNPDGGRFGLFAHAIAVDLKDYVRARTDNPDVPTTAYELAAMQSLAACQDWGFNIANENSFELFYDQGESFYRHVRDRLDNKRALKDLPILKQIIGHGQYNSRYLPALQLADLFAWSVAHGKNKNQFSWQKRMLAHHFTIHWMTYEEMVNPRMETVELREKWKLPKRPPHH